MTGSAEPHQCAQPGGCHQCRYAKRCLARRRDAHPRSTGLWVCQADEGAEHQLPPGATGEGLWIEAGEDPELCRVAELVAADCATQARIPRRLAPDCPDSATSRPGG